MFELLKPETELEEKIIADKNFQLGCTYGEPRSGHPEGKIVFHIIEVLENVRIYASPTEQADLRLVGLIHDTFKYLVDKNKPKTGENHHAMIARKFAERYFQISRVLNTIELHDEAYNSWQLGERKNDWKAAEERAKRLIQKLGSDLDFYLTFYYCDNHTGNKSVVNYEWFKELAGRV